MDLAYNVRIMSTALAIVPRQDLAQPWQRPDLIESFLSGRNPRTLQAYSDDLQDFARFIGAQDIDEASQQLLAQGHGGANSMALSYRAHLIGRGLAPVSINRKLAALRSLVKLANTLGLVPWSLQVPNLPSQSYRDTTGPGRAGFKAMLEEATHARDRAILRLLHSLGLRRSEVVNLDLADIDLEAGTVWILGKGRSQKERLTLPPTTRAALEAWISIRGSAPGPLFFTFARGYKGQGRRLGSHGLYFIVRKLGRKAGLTVRPHGLRHAGITAGLDLTNGNVRAVQKFSRHRDLRILTIYDDNRLDLGGDVARLVDADIGLG